MATATKRSKTTKQEKKPTTDEDLTLQEHLDRAHIAVAKARAATDSLHENWRQYLLRLSYMVAIITFQQAQTPMTNCIRELKLVNVVKNNNSEDPFSGFDAFIAVIGDSVVEILSIMCAVSLACMLNKKASNSDFTSKEYGVSTACIPMIISLYFHKKTIGCIDDTDLLQQAYESDTVEVITRGFPVVLIFHTMVTIAVGFMQYQIAQQDTNIEMVAKLSRDLIEAKEQSQPKKTT